MSAKPREDILVSVCFPDFQPTQALGDALLRLSHQLAASFRYWEILLMAPADLAPDFEPLLGRVANVRLLKIRRGTPFYRRRVMIAAEAIGDVVLLAAAEELAALDPVAMIGRAAAEGAIIVGQRSSSSLFNPALRALGRSAGFRVNGRDMLTAAYPRTLLNQLLAHPDRQLALRFAPADSAVPVTYLASNEQNGPPRAARALGRRLLLVQKLLISSAPGVLTLVSLFALMVTVCAFGFGIYAVVVWLTFASVQPGWFTTALALSLTAAFLGAAIFGLSIGLQKLIEALAGDVMDDILDERSAVDLFSQVMQELNVEIGTGEAAEDMGGAAAGAAAGGTAGGTAVPAAAPAVVPAVVPVQNGSASALQPAPHADAPAGTGAGAGTNAGAGTGAAAAAAGQGTLRGRA